MIKTEKSIVIFVDVQNDFIDGALKNEEAIKRLPLIIDFAKSLTKNPELYKVYATQDTHYEDYLDSTLEGKNLPVSHCIKDSFGWEVNSELKDILDSLDNVYVNKETFGCLDLPNIIKSDLRHGVIDSFNKIVICGYVSSICVLANALILRAAFPNMKIEVLENLCAGISEVDHNAAMECLKMQQIDVIKY